MCLDYNIVMPRLAAYSENFQQEFVYQNVSDLLGIQIGNPDAFINAIQTPLHSAKVFFKLYAFARAGGQNVRYEEICLDLLQNGFNWQNGDEFYQAFLQQCQQRNIGPNERNNRGVVIQGYERNRNNETGWLHRLGSQINHNNDLRSVYLCLLSVRGIGFKIASLICRDLVWAFGIENNIPMLQSPLLQPIDRWIWRVIRTIWPEFNPLAPNDTPDSGIQLFAAIKLAEVLPMLNISGVEFNQGTWFFCNQLVVDRNLLHQRLLELQQDQI